MAPLQYTKTGTIGTDPVSSGRREERETEERHITNSFLGGRLAGLFGEKLASGIHCRE